jgi:hypothetical protein
LEKDSDRNHRSRSTELRRALDARTVEADWRGFTGYNAAGARGSMPEPEVAVVLKIAKL